MMKYIAASALLFVFSCSAFAQTKPRPRPTPVKPASKAPVKPPVQPGPDHGTVSGRTYTNQTLGFELVFPDTWLIPGDDFEAEMKKQGFDLSLKAPSSLTAVSQAKVNRALQNVTILLTAYRSMPGTADNAIMRVSMESIDKYPQIKDAVDYFDAIRATYRAMTLPPDFKYSETQAEQLGTTQFGYLDTSSKDGKKRMYTIVRKDLAIMFTLTYSNDDDLFTMRRILEEGNFRLKKL